tara:strand:+ start:2069 stop:2800 length:732 start_codon:yes stop_codon:yes gene_type:complete
MFKNFAFQNPFRILGLQVILLILALVSFNGVSSLRAQNVLTQAEKDEGWKLLFDGKTIEGWRSYANDSFPESGWVIEDGTLHKQGGVKYGDIMTVDTYEDFEFAWEWKLEQGGNNGVKYFITAERGAPIGHEYQMIDDATTEDQLSSSASFYLVVAPNAAKPLRPPGEWNSSRIVVSGNRVEHWLNGAKVLSYDCGSPEILEKVANTKYKKFPGFGNKVSGHIMLTDHSDACWFRNLKIRTWE